MTHHSSAQNSSMATDLA